MNKQTFITTMLATYTILLVSRYMGRSDAALFAQQQTANEKSFEIVQCFFVLRVYMSRRALKILKQ